MTVRSEASPRAAGTPHSLTDWVRAASDADLVALLRRRPDLALPAPVDLATLANRASVRSSIARALDQLDAFTLRVAEVVTAIGSHADADTVRSWFRPADRPAVDDALDRLRAWLLVWGPSDDLRPAGALREVIGPYPAGLGRGVEDLFAAVNDIVLVPLLRGLGLPPTTQPTSGNAAAAAVLARLDALLADCDDAERSVLTRLADGPPIGALRNATGGAFEGASAGPGRSLVARGLLIPIDRNTVELPREVGLRLRDYPAGDVRPEPAPIETTERDGSTVDRGGATEVLEVVRLVELLLTAIAHEPPTQLRSGGLGVRELRRLARAVDVNEQTTALLIEIAYESGLLAATSHVDASYLPTTEFDTWTERDTAERWVQLASGWLAMTRLPSLVGERDERDKVIAVLSADVERHSAPALRLQLLTTLAAVPPGHTPVSPDQVLARLAWQSPRRASASRATAAAMLGEAAALGVTGYGALTGYARALVDAAATGATQAEANAASALAAAIPASVEEFLLQPDLTAVVPGPPTTQLRRELELAADLESTGGASVYRISPTSLRRALDAGRTGSDLADFFTRCSRTPVPQALEYLINDVATQHGRLRTGTATSYLRCDDVALLDRVVAEPALDSLGLQRIAPTVVISNAGISTVLERLRATGFAPAAESSDGAVISLAADAPRVPARPHSRVSRVRSSSLPDTQLAEVVARLRAGERLSMAMAQSTNRVSQQVPGVTSASILELLRTAIRAERTIALGYVDDTGTPSQRTMLPISLGGGMVRGHDPSDSRLRSYPLQRITTVTMLDD